MSAALAAFLVSAITPVLASPAAKHTKAQLSDVIVHKRTLGFIDIEAPIDQTWIGCSEDGPTPNANSHMMLYAFDGNALYEFYNRRIYDVRMCLEVEQKYHRLIRGSKTVRIVGGKPREEANPSPVTNKRVPKWLYSVPKMISQVFFRLQAGGRCAAYFPDDCDLPKNYWGETIPEPTEKAKP